MILALKICILRRKVFYSGAVSLYGSTNAVWHDYIIACLDGTGVCEGKTDSFRQYVINKCLIGVVTAYATYEFGAAVWKGENAETADTQAAYAWDEGAAFYIGNIDPVIGDGYTGSAPGNLYSPYEFNWKRDIDFPDGTSTHTEAVPILNYGLINLPWRCLQCGQCESSRVSHVQDLLHCCHPKCHQVRMEGLQWWHHGAKVPRRGLGLLEECLRLHVHLQCHHRAGGG